ncbi:hypothetical protein [Minisyncoccus archaeiphilus]|jgi:hypothetical protein|uniref:hypothetical protein n=1 Tax=Minisyncoccus archaeiphilus TaxID=3238481 RepID=UPI00399CCAC6
MFEPILNRVKAGMSLEDCIVSIAGGNYELSIAILDACDLHIRVWSENNPNAIVMMLDMMRLYDDDLLILYNEICEKDVENFLVVLWSYEMGLYRLKSRQEVPGFCKLSMIKSLISDVKEGRSVGFPFEEAKRLLGSTVRR